MAIPLEDLMADVLVRVKGVVQLDSRAGLAAGGQYGDPTMRGAPLPCAWPIYAGDISSEPEQVGTANPVIHEVLIKVLTAYNTESDLTTISYPTLQAVVQAMTATPVGATKSACERWHYESQSLEEIDDRLVYIQRYTISGNL